MNEICWFYQAVGTGRFRFHWSVSCHFGQCSEVQYVEQRADILNSCDGIKQIFFSHDDGRFMCAVGKTLITKAFHPGDRGFFWTEAQLTLTERVGF